MLIKKIEDKNKFEERKNPDGSWEPAGVRGSRWQSFMRDYYPDEYKIVVEKDLLFPLAYRVDEESEKLWDTLETSYKQRNDNGILSRIDIEEIRGAIQRELFKPYTELF